MRSRPAAAGDGRLVCFLRTHVNPSGDAKNMVVVVSEDDGFTWTPPKWTNIWGYPRGVIPLQDGRYLMIYGYRRPPYGTAAAFPRTASPGTEERVRHPRGRRARRQRGRPAGLDADEPRSGKTAAAASTGRIPASISISAIRAWRRCPTGRSSPPITSGARTTEPLQYVRCTRFRLVD